MFNFFMLHKVRKTCNYSKAQLRELAKAKGLGYTDVLDDVCLVPVFGATVIQGAWIGNSPACGQP